MLLSGGIDSGTCLYLARKERVRVNALTLVYRGMARRELESARALAKAGGVTQHRVARLPDLKEAKEISGVKFAGLPSTYIPLRNSIFYSYAASFAEETNADTIIGGHNRDDQSVFRDVRPRFFTPLEKAIREASAVLDSRRLKIERPLQSRSKPEVIRLAVRLGVPLELTWSCHRNGRTHCWRCQGCLSRRRSFEKSGTVDPLRALTAGKIT